MVNAVSWLMWDDAIHRAKAPMTIMAEAASAMEHAVAIAEQAVKAFKDSGCEKFEI